MRMRLVGAYKVAKIPANDRIGQRRRKYQPRPWLIHGESTRESVVGTRGAFRVSEWSLILHSAGSLVSRVGCRNSCRMNTCHAYLPRLSSRFARALFLQEHKFQGTNHRCRRPIGCLTLGEHCQVLASNPDFHFLVVLTLRANGFGFHHKKSDFGFGGFSILLLVGSAAGSAAFYSQRCYQLSYSTPARGWINFPLSLACLLLAFLFIRWEFYCRKLSRR